MRYLLALGSSPPAAALGRELQGVLNAAGHRKTGPAVLLSHQLLDTARATEPDVLIASRALGGDVALADALLAVRKALPGVRIVVLLGQVDGEARALAQALAQAAVFDLLPGTVRAQDVAAALDREASYDDVRALVEAPAAGGTAEPGARGQVLAVLGARPGVGAGTVVANLAYLLASRGETVEALDLRDLPALGVLLHAGQAPGGGLRRPGLAGVGVTESPDPALIEPTARRAAWTLVVLPADPSDTRAAAALVAAQYVVLVVTPDPIAVSGAGPWVREGRVTRPILVLNRHVPEFTVSPALVQQVLGVAVSVVLPENPAAHWGALQHRQVAATSDPRAWQSLLDALGTGRTGRWSGLRNLLTFRSRTEAN